MKNLIVALLFTLTSGLRAQAGDVDFTSEGKIVSYALIVVGVATYGSLAAGKQRSIRDAALGETTAVIAGGAFVGAGAIVFVTSVLFDLSRKPKTEQKQAQARYRSMLRTSELVLSGDVRATSSSVLNQMAVALKCEVCQNDQEKQIKMAKLNIALNSVGVNLPSTQLTEQQEAGIVDSIRGALQTEGLDNEQNIALGKSIVALAKFNTQILQ